MRERLLKILPLVGYPIFYFICLFVFAMLTFPYDKLKQRIVASYNSEPRGPGAAQELQIDEMSGYWLSGVRVKGARLVTASAEPGKPPQKIEIDEATVRASILSAMIGNSDLSFDVFAFGGETKGSYAVSGKDKSVDVTLDAVDVGEVDPLVQLLGVPLQGKLSGTVKLSMPGGLPSKANGAVALEVTTMAVGDGKAKLKGALALPKMDVGTLDLEADAKDGLLKISKLAAGGRDVELQGDGRITLRDSFGDALCDGQVKFKINDAYKTKNDVTKSLFGAPGSNVPALFEMADPKIKQAKRPDGFYGWTLRGTIARMDFIPAGGGVGAGGPAGGVNPMGVLPPNPFGSRGNAP
jgi:type II secretion system protein N